MKNFTFSRYPMYHTFNRWWKLYLDSYEGGELVFDEEGRGFPLWQEAGKYERIP